jgi:hypothetical protein
MRERDRRRKRSNESGDELASGQTHQHPGVTLFAGLGGVKDDRNRTIRAGGRIRGAIDPRSVRGVSPVQPLALWGSKTPTIVRQRRTGSTGFSTYALNPAARVRLRLCSRP